MVASDPRSGRLCQRCSGQVEDSPSVTVLRCGRCRHNFVAREDGFAGVSLVPKEGWMGDDFRQYHLCPSCRDALRSWLGVLPPGTDPSMVPPGLG